MEKKQCYKCGAMKVASRIFGSTIPIEMVKITYGKHKNQFRCNDCKK